MSATSFEPSPVIHEAIDEETIPNYSSNDFHSTHPGQVLNDRYQTIAKLGWEVGSTVWLAEDLRRCKEDPESLKYVTVKIGTCQHRSNAAAENELKLSQRIAAANPSHPGSSYIRVPVDNFRIHESYGVHICLVYHPLRETLYGKMLQWRPEHRSTAKDLLEDPFLDIGDEAIHDESNIRPALIRKACFYSPPLDGTEPSYITLDMRKDGVRNYPHHEADVTIRDMRGHEGNFTLDTHGFQAVTDNSVGAVDLSIKHEIEAVYIPKVKQLLLRHMEGAFKVVVFDTTIRRAAESELLHRPVRKIHIDQSARGAYLRAKHTLSMGDAKRVEAGELRFRIVNVWKPLNGPVIDHPLMFADSTTVREEDLIPVEQRYPHYSGETYALKYSPGAEFWFWSEMGVSDLVLLQCYDSVKHFDTHGVERRTRCAHGSFKLTGSDEEVFTRSSIELRCIVLG